MLETDNSHTRLPDQIGRLLGRYTCAVVHWAQSAGLYPTKHAEEVGVAYRQVLQADGLRITL